MKKKYLLTLAALTTLLAGCGENSASPKPSSPSDAPISNKNSTPSVDSTKPSTPSTKPSTPSTPSTPVEELPTELVNADLDNAFTDDITFGVNAAIDMSVVASTGNIPYITMTKDSDIKLGDGLYLEDADLTVKQLNDSYQYETSTTSGKVGYWKGVNDFITYNSAPDIHNKTEETVIRQNFALLENPLEGNLDETYFEYDAANSTKEYSAFKVNDEYIDDSEVRAHLDDITAFYCNVGLGSLGDVVTQLGGSSSDISLDKFEAKVGLEGLIGFDYAYSYQATSTSASGSMTMVLSYTGSIEIKDEDKTGLQLSDIKYTPFVKTANADTQYAAFDKAKAAIAKGDYLYEATVLEKTSKMSGYKGAVLKDEYASFAFDYDLGTPKMDDVVYSGVHKVSDGVYNYYSSSTAAVAGGSAKVSGTVVPTFDFDSAIFEYDAKKSTADEYVFNLRSEMDDLEVASLLAVYSFNNADNLSVTITKDGVFKGFSFTYTGTSSYSSSIKTTYTVKFEFSAIGTTTAIPAEYGTFEGFVPYVTPTAYKQLGNVIDYDAYQQSGSITILDDDLEAVLKSVVGETIYASLPNVLKYGEIGDAYYASLYSKSSKFIEMQFDYDSADSLSAALTAVVTGLTKDGVTLTQDSTYGYYVWTSGDVSMIIGASTSNGYYTLVVEVEVASATAA